jgi:hypothetical protein
MSQRTIHDLSRIERNADDLPRFNMPFELGLAMGAKYFNSRKKHYSALILVREPYVLPAYLSDLGGNDPRAHGGDPRAVIRLVTSFLHASPSGHLLPGPAHTMRRFEAFRQGLPLMAEALHWRHEEVDPYRHYRVYLHLITEFLRVEQRAGR